MPENNLSNKLKNLYYDFQNDPFARKKYTFYIISFVAFVILISLLLYFSSFENSSQEEDKTNIQSQESLNLATKFLDITFNNDSRNLLVSPSGVVGVNDKGNFLYKSLVEHKGLDVAPVGVNYITNIVDLPQKNQAIINTDLQKTYLFTNNQIQIYPSVLFSLTPVAQESAESGFYGIARDFDGVNVFLYEDIDLVSGYQTSLAALPKNFTYDYVEIQSFKNKPYVFIWKGSQLSIHSVNTEKKSLERLFFIEDLVSVKRGADKFLYNTNKDGFSELFMIDFSKEAKGNLFALPVKEKLTEKNIESTVLSQKCDFYKDFEIICLVKEKPTNFDDPRTADKIFVFNYVTTELTFKYEDLLASSLRIFVDKNKDVYILETSGLNLWKLTRE